MPARPRFKFLALLPLLTLLTACPLDKKGTTKISPDADLAIDPATHPEQRYFEGTIISLTPTTNTMKFSMGKKADEINFVETRYDRDTKFYINDAPAAVSDITPYSPARVKAHMVYTDKSDTEGTCIVDVVKFGPPPASVRVKPIDDATTNK